MIAERCFYLPQWPQLANTAVIVAAKRDATPTMTLREAIVKQQGDLFEVDIGWARVMRSQFRSGEVREIGPIAYEVYLCIKAHADLQSGASQISEAEIATMLGVSERTIQRAVVTLEKRAYLTRVRNGRGNTYWVREKIVIQQAGETHETAVITADMPYVPSEMARYFQEIVDACKAGQFANTYNVTFVFNQNSFTVSGNENSVNVVNNTTARPAPPELDTLPPSLRPAMQRIRAKLGYADEQDF